MPFSRKKSCVKCRESKARCNQNLPICSRCIDRGLRCVYEGDVRASPYYLTQRASRSLFGGSQLVDESFSGFLPDEDMVDMRTDAFLPPLRDSALPGLDQAALSFDWSSLDTPKVVEPFSFEATHLGAPQAALMERDTPQASGSLFLSSDSSDLLPETYMPNTINNFPSPKKSCESALERRPSRSPLRKRHVLKHCVLTNIAIGQMTSYPRMMIEGDQLPPFIHPPCYIEEQLAPDCGEKGSHQCLPKDLAICAGLVKMFYARTKENADFIWRSIYTEQRTLHAEFHGYDGDRQLSALQAAIVYLLLQAEDTESAERNGAAALLSAVMEMVYHLSETQVWRAPDTSLGRPSRRSWTYAESLRRIFIFLGIIELLLDGVMEPPEQTGPCRGFRSFPLPCSRDLWLCRTNRAWRAAFDRYLKTRKTEKMLTVADLLLLDEQGTLNDLKRGEGGLVMDVVKWSEGLDQLGTLVWMIVPFEKWRKTSESVSEIW